ncbi:MAG: hypothetical protein ABJG78_06640 [Cyclobacteriaceae bacterium]
MKERTTTLEKFAPILKRIERVLWIALIFGIILNYFGQNTLLVIQFSLSLLSVLFFLFAFTRSDVPTSKGEQTSFKELLAWAILPKILWVSAAVSTIALLMSTLELSNDAYLRMLPSGIGGNAIATIVLSFLFLSGTKHMQKSLQVLLRTIPILLASLQLFSNAM